MECDEWIAQRLLKKPFPKTVNHRGYVYLETFSASWIREDGLRVDITIRVDQIDGPIPMAVTISGPSGIRGEYRQPVPAMARQAAANNCLKADGKGNATLPKAGPIPMGRPQPRPGRASESEREAKLKRVAEIYKRAVAKRKPVTTAVKLAFGVKESTAQSLIWQARKAGLLPATEPGKRNA